jgi:osmotically-inducible protein OsmY
MALLPGFLFSILSHSNHYGGKVMRNRNPRRGDRWDDRDRADSYDRDRGLSPEDGPFRRDEEYLGQHELYGRGLSSGNAPENRATSWRTSRGYARDDDRRDRGRYVGGYNERENRGSSDKPDSWVGRSNFEVGFGGWGRNEYDRNSYDPYWAADREGDYDREQRRRRHWWDKAADEVASWFGDNEADSRRQMDTRREGDYRGRGPKGYTRSDERIKDDLNDRLTDDYAIDASDIEVDVTAGDVILSGTVESRFEKRRAEDLAERVSGVRNVENRIRVNDRGRYGWDSSSSDEYSNEQSRGEYFAGETGDRSRGVGGGTT